MEENRTKNKVDIRKILFVIFGLLFAGGMIGLAVYGAKTIRDKKALEAQNDELNRIKQEALAKAREMAASGLYSLDTGAQETVNFNLSEEELNDLMNQVPAIMSEYQELYDANNYMIGWLTIDGTNVDYPVVQTPEDENMYLYRDFYGRDNNNGTLIMDTDSTVGIGCKENNYFAGEKPGTNLIIHGHTMRSGVMFGKLNLYKDADYCKEHSIIKFDSLYEKREYEVCAVFTSRVFYTYETDVFKYYNFFDAANEEEFNYWYQNIKEMSLYDTGVEAEFGDEFITLSCCAYHVPNGRFVVVGKRIK